MHNNNYTITDNVDHNRIDIILYVPNISIAMSYTRASFGYNYGGVVPPMCCTYLYIVVL